MQNRKQHRLSRRSCHRPDDIEQHVSPFFTELSVYACKVFKPASALPRRTQRMRRLCLRCFLLACLLLGAGLLGLFGLRLFDGGGAANGRAWQLCCRLRAHSRALSQPASGIGENERTVCLRACERRWRGV